MPGIFAEFIFANWQLARGEAVSTEDDDPWGPWHDKAARQIKNLKKSSILIIFNSTHRLNLKNFVLKKLFKEFGAKSMPNDPGMLKML
jgi:hypothetical protein